MIHHDYLLRLIEQFMRALAQIRDAQQSPGTHQANQLVDRELERLIASNREDILRLGTTELLARILRQSAAHEVRTKALYLVTLLKESGDLALAEGDETQAHQRHHQALRLLLETLERPDLGDCPQFAPTVDALAGCLNQPDIPLETLALLMRHYERGGEFGKAEDVLYSILDAQPTAPEVKEFGVAFYRRLLLLGDATLHQGNLCRAEVLEGLANLDARPA